MCCFQKELPYGSISDTRLRDLQHGEAIVSANPKTISSIIKQSEYFDEEILKKANNRFYTPDEFNSALKSFDLVSQLFCMRLNISSLSYHYLELYNLLSNLKIKPNIIGISETKCNRVKGYGIIYPNDVIERLIYNIKNVRIAKNSTFQCHLFALLHLLLGKKCNRVKGHGMI